MKSFTTIAALAALTSTASAARCQNLTIPVTISAQNTRFTVQAPTSNIEVTNFILNLTQQGGTFGQSIQSGAATVSGSYSIAATYCTPDSGSSQTIQILTHGIGFDRSYWDLPYNNYNYSYVREAVDGYGYSTFTWDRLGIGMSSHGEPVNEIQAPLEVAALKYLTEGIRAGNISGISAKPEKVLHAGHSFGSSLTYALTSAYPTISDGIALTGFSQNGSFVPYFALGSNFILANQVAALSSYPDGYLANGLPTGVQIDFLAPNQFDPDILTYAYKNGQPVTVGELLTVATATMSINNFTGPVLIITGDRDIPFCGGNCMATGGAASSIPQQSFMTIPKATNPQAVVVPNAGHGLNFEYSHQFTYGTILNYFTQNGCAP